MVYIIKDKCYIITFIATVYIASENKCNSWIDKKQNNYIAFATSRLVYTVSKLPIYIPLFSIINKQYIKQAHYNA